MSVTESFTAFSGHRQFATGELLPVAQAAFTEATHGDAPILILDDLTGTPIELDLRHSSELAVAGYQARMSRQEPITARPGRGRPKLGVTAREVTLLPRHWEWLATQPGGASVALRKLVEVARRSSEVKDRVRQASAIGYKFMSTIAGHEVGFEEASRALFAGDQAGFEALIAGWPVDVQSHLKKLLVDAFWA